MSAEQFSRQVHSFKERVRTMIVRAELSEGVRIDEALLRQETGVTVRAGRQALSELAEEGLIVRKRHVGTFVSGRLPGATFAVLPRIRSVGILSSRPQSFFAKSVYGATLMTGVQAGLHAPIQITFFVHPENRHMSIDDMPMTESDTIKRACQGLLAIEANNASHLNELAGSGVPVVAVDFSASGAAFDAIEVDHFSAGYLATRHLIGLGHRRIAFVGEGPMPDSSDPTWQSRLNGYYRAILEAGLEGSPGAIANIGRSDTRVRDAVQNVLRRFKPTAFVVCTGGVAEATTLALAELGQKVPDDVSLTAADSASTHLQGRLLSQVRVDYEILGRNAMRLLASRLACRAMPPLRLTQPVSFLPGATARSLF
jgi:DNA-binding LacI/PurR family transcriptional regulator